MKKFFYTAITILQALLLISIPIIEYFSTKKMGMMRYMVYQNQLWQKQYPITTLKYIAISIFIVLIMISLIFYFRKSNAAFRKISLPIIIVNVILTVVFIFFTLAYSTSSFRAYYFICISLATATFIQNIKILVYFKIKNV